MKTLTFLLLAALALPAHAQSIHTFIFKDVIASNGRGDIDLFTPKSRDVAVSGPVLELFRQDNGGDLVFAVDVNEASSGSESAESQGLAIAGAVLHVEFAEQTVSYTDFSTPTRSLLAAAGDLERRAYHTLIGTAGSNRVSPSADSELTGSSLDETLHFVIDRSLESAIGARLQITLLDSNIDLGDPEAFYDYSNGYEEVALLTRSDAEYLQALAPGREMAPLVLTDQTAGAESYSWVYYPSSQGHYVASYEDLYPTPGDYDFNDLVVAYQVSVGTDGSGAVRAIRGNGYLVARGASYDHDWHLRIPLPAAATGTSSVSVYPAGSHDPLPGYPRSGSINGTADLVLAEHVAAIFQDSDSTYVNTFPEQNLVQGPKFEFEITLETPLAPADIGAAPFDPYLYVHDTGYEVHLIGKSPVLGYSQNVASGHTSFRDQAGNPFAMVIPEYWNPPLAGVDMGLAYPDFVTHIGSNGSKKPQWYLAPDAARVKSIPQAHWKW